MQASEFLSKKPSPYGAGLYVVQPNFAQAEALFKFGRTSGSSRIAEYRLFWPKTLGGYRVHAYLNTSRRPGQTTAREQRLFSLAAKHGFVRDSPYNEWFRYTLNPESLEHSLWNLFFEVRTGSDGYFWVFPREAPARRGGRLPLDETGTAVMQARRLRSSSTRAYLTAEGGIRELRGLRPDDKNTGS